MEIISVGHTSFLSSQGGISVGPRLRVFPSVFMKATNKHPTLKNT